MRSVIRAAAVLLAGAAAPASAAQPVQIVVHVPADTPADAEVFLAGSLPSVGGFRPNGFKLTRRGDGAYAGELNLDLGKRLEFKITRGSWQTVEKNADGSERPNRVLEVDAATREFELTVERWATGEPAGAPRPSTVVGTLKLHEIESKPLQQTRTIRVWLPPGYDAAANTRYGVLYMHDGQNCFDLATSAFGDEWEVDETLTKLIEAKQIEPLIVVGVDNGLARRIDEYTFAAEPNRGGGEGAAYAEFLLKDVKPFVDATYRTRPERAHTFLGGSSLGGLVSLEIARRHPDMFGGVMAMSPALRWADESLARDVERDPGGLAKARVWLDMGMRENLAAAAGAAAANERLIDAAQRLSAALEKHGVEHQLVIDAEHPEHNERAWAQRFPRAVEYVVGGDQ
jgi:predicted alpha/beta superfamily hydrolase